MKHFKLKLTEDQHRQIKVQAAQSGMSMNAWMVERLTEPSYGLEEVIKEYGEKEGPQVILGSGKMITLKEYATHEAESPFCPHGNPFQYYCQACADEVESA